MNGFGAIPLYKFLKEKQGGGLGISAIKWNFTKYVDITICPISRFARGVQRLGVGAFSFASRQRFRAL